MPSITNEQLKGNYGAALIMARLSAHCLVRPVAADTDVGIDLYCETLEDGKFPFLHFWVQVKAGKQCRPLKKQRVSCNFEHNKLVYWSRQPVPVFAALVPIAKWPAKTHGNDIYIIDLTDQLLSKSILQRKSKNHRLRSNIYWPKDNIDCVESFLKEIVPATFAKQQISRGVIERIPTLTKNYFQEIPNVPVLDYTREIINQLRITAASSIIFSYATGSKIRKTQYRDFIKKMARIVEVLSDQSHWEDFFVQALNQHSNEKCSAAHPFYQRAMQCISGDPNGLLKREGWANMYALIKSLDDHSLKGLKLDFHK
jgi:hypothetical protein